MGKYDELVRRLIELDAKATPGPWRRAKDGSGDLFISGPGGQYVMEIGAPDDDTAEGDADLVEALRNAIPQIATAITTLEAELAAMKEENAELITWRDAVDDHLVASCLGTWESFPDAATAMNRLLEWETTIALDPKVSKPAHDLLAAMKARGDRLAEYVMDDLDCQAWHHIGAKCTCGLSEALAEWRD